jgi:histidinol dehydrogenase
MITIYELDKMSAGDFDRIKMRADSDISEVRPAAEKIIERVRREGDEALIALTKEFDDPFFSAERLRITEVDVVDAYENTAPETVELIQEEILLSRRFHAAQKRQLVDWEKELEPGIKAGEKWTAISEVGLYVPGGKNPFPSTQQFLAVPASLAGCRRIVSCISPRGKNYEVIIAAIECGVKEIYRVAGAQAIAAMAYGTESIRPVQLIAGPGNPYVTAAKMLCQQKVSIDMPAGPSEALILADESLQEGLDLRAKAAFCASDILAQAEHGPDSAGILVTNSRMLAQFTREEITRQFQTVSRHEYLKTSLTTYSAIIITKTLDAAIQFANEYAPEHLEILTEDPRETLAEIEHAGSVFLGPYNPVAAGDYATGVNHVLPASGWARQTSALSVATFMKKVQYSEVTKQGLKRLQPVIQSLATIEGLDAHRESVEIRFKSEPAISASGTRK